METMNANQVANRNAKLPQEYQSFADEIVAQLKSEAALALQDLSVNSKGRSSAKTQTGLLFHAAFQSSLKGNTAKAAKIFETAKPFLQILPVRKPVITGNAATVSHENLVLKPTDTGLQPIPVTVNSKYEEPSLHINKRDLDLKSSLLVLNRSVQCIKETDGFLGGDDEIAISVIIIDPLGNSHIGKSDGYKGYKLGNFENGTTKTEGWEFASLDLTQFENIRWPQTYTIITTLAEIDSGGFASYIDDIIGKIQSFVKSKVSEYITAALLAAYGAVIADAAVAAIAATVGISVGGSVGSIVPVIGTVIGAIVGAIVGFVAGEVFGAIKRAVDDDIFPPGSNQLTISSPGDSLGGSYSYDSIWEWPNDDGGHYIVDLIYQLQWGKLGGASAPSPYRFNNPDSQQLAYTDADRNIDILWVKDGAWVWTNAGVQASAPLAMSDPFAYIDIDGQNQHIVYTTADFKVCELYSTPQGWAVNPNLAILMPGVGKPAGFFWGSTHCVAYLGLDGHIYVSWVQNGQWVSNCPSGDAGSPKSISSPSAVVSLDGKSQSIYYTGEDHHIYQLWCYVGGGWHYTDVSIASNIFQLFGTSLKIGNAQAYSSSHPYTRRYPGNSDNLPVDIEQAQYVCFTSLYGLIWLCKWDGSKWSSEFINQIAKAPMASGEPFVIFKSEVWNESIVYRGKDGHIYRLYRNTEEEWGYSSPTKILELPIAIGNPSGFYVGTNNLLTIFYLAVDLCYYSMWWDHTNWGWEKISDVAQSPTPAA